MSAPLDGRPGDTVKLWDTFASPVATDASQPVFVPASSKGGRNITVSYRFGTAPTALTLTIQKSVDNVTWVDVGTFSALGQDSAVFNADGFVRGYLTALTGGANLTLEVQLGTNVAFDSSGSAKVINITEERIDFTGIARVSGTQLIKAGTYSAKLACPAGAGTSQISMHTKQTSTPFTYQSFCSLGLSGADNDGVVGSHFTLDVDSGGSSASIHTGELHLNLATGSILKAGGAAAVADGTCLWLKVYGAATAPAANSKLAGLWVDHQLSVGSPGAGSKEYGIFVTAGGTVPTAILGTKTTSGGWAALVAFEDNAAPVGNAVSAAAGSDKSIKVTVAGTDYFIPLYDSLSA